MNRTHLLLAFTALLALGAGWWGMPGAEDGPSVTNEGKKATTPVRYQSDQDVGQGALSLQGKLSGEYLLAQGETYAALTVSASGPRDVKRQPVNLALVIDRSGSMRGQKLVDAKRAARMLVERLSADDRLTLVHYGTDVRVFPAERVTADARERMLSFVDAIEDDGATNISGGLEAAIEQLKAGRQDFRVSRAMLLSDGQPTEGITEDLALRQLVARYREEGITVSGLGVGEDFNEQLMRGLAEQGGGFYGYIQDSERLAEVLQRELDQATGTLARGVVLKIRLTNNASNAEVLGVASRRDPRDTHTLLVPLYDMADGQTARVMVRLKTDLRAARGPRDVLAAQLLYQNAQSGEAVVRTLYLTAKVTEDAQEVREHLDGEMELYTARALGAQQMQAAAEEMKRGNRERALGLLDDVRRRFAASSSADALAGEIADVDVAQSAYRGAQDETSVKHEALKLHRKSLQSFGQNNSY